MLIYGAFSSAVRPLVLVVAGLSKLFFIALVLSHGTRYTGGQAGVSIAVDSVMVAVFAACLVALQCRRPGV